MPGISLFTKLNYPNKYPLRLIQRTISSLNNALLASPARLLTAVNLLIPPSLTWDKVLFQPERPGGGWGKYASLRRTLPPVPKKLISPERARPVHRQLLAICADEATAQTFIGYASIS